MGKGLRRVAVLTFLASVTSTSLQLAAPPSAYARSAGVQVSWDDVNASHWAARAIDYVAGSRRWMRDFGPSTFRPERAESRRLLARAVVRAFLPMASPGSAPEFADVSPDDRFYPFIAVAVERGWMSAEDGVFRPREAVTTEEVHKALVVALGLRPEMRGLNRIGTEDGIRLRHEEGFGAMVLGMVLGLRTDHASERQEVGPGSSLSRAEVAFSLWRANQAATVARWKLGALAPYAQIELPELSSEMRQVAEFGFRYVGYPYVWGAEWPTATSSGYCCGTQSVGGFDCSGLIWWTMKSAVGGYQPTAIRPYAGWSLPQRSSKDMASVGRAIPYRRSRPGDLLFFDGDRNGVVDHVSLSLGRGWALDASNSYGGTSVIRVGEGWYRDRFTHARRIIG